MKLLLAVLIAGLTTAASPASQALDAVKNERLAHILMNVQVLRETSPDEAKAFHVRILLVPGQGECGTTAQSCPKSELFIAVSSIDEYPDQRVYQLPGRHAWRFVRWNRLPKVDGPFEYVEFTLEADDPSPHPESKWWRTTQYDVRVNYHDGSVTEHRAG